jgi:ribonuclease J
MSELQILAAQVLDECECRHMTDWASIKSAVKGELSNFLYKKTKRNPMILPIIMEV